MAAIVVDDFQDDVAGRNALGLDIGGVGLDRAGEEPGLLTAVQNMPDSYAYFRLLYGRPLVLAWSAAGSLRWSQPGASYTTELGGLDVRGRAVFALRARSDQPGFTGAGLAVQPGPARAGVR